MKTFVTIIFLFLLVVFSVMWFSNITNKVFTLSDSSMSFSYSPLYFIDEAPLTGNPFYAISLVEATPENELYRQGKSSASEGPTSIDIRIYQKNTEGSLDQWLTLTRESTWSVSRGLPNKSSISGLPALAYKWSGLYGGDAVVVDAGSRVYVFTVSYMSENDKIRKVFSNLLNSVKITEI